MARVALDVRIGGLSRAASHRLAAAVGAAILAVAASRLPGALASRTWPHVEGRITWRAEGGVEYAYTVEGRDHVGDRLLHAPLLGFWLRSRDCALTPGFIGACGYERNATVPVYYDPANPADAVLEPGLRPSHAGWLLAGLAFIAPLALDRRRATIG
jgi:hypothetical protein